MPARRDADVAPGDLKPAYERVIAWGRSELADGAERQARRGLAARRRRLVRRGAQAQHHDRPHRRSDPRRSVSRKLRASRASRTRSPARPGFKDRKAFYADRAKRFPPPPWTDALARRLSEAQPTRRSRTTARLLPAVFDNLPSTGRGGPRAVVQRSRRRRRPRLRPQPRRRPPGPGLRPPARQHRRPGHDHRPDVPRGHSRPRDAGRHPGPPDRRAEVPPRLPLRRLRRGLGALRRAALQGDGRLSGRRLRLHAPGRRAVPRRAPGHRHRHPRQVGPRTRPSTT